MTRETLPAAAWLPLLREALAREGRFRMPLRGNSMLPTLPPACEIDVVPLAAPRVGQLVVFVAGGLQGDALVAHRIVRRAGVRWIAQGDNRRGPDAPLTVEQMLGRVAGAYVDERRVWPGPAEGARAARWIARHWALRGARWVWRRLALRPGGARAGDETQRTRKTTE